MDRATLRKTAFTMPPTSPAFPLGPYRFVDREYFIIRYRTEPEALRRVVPDPLEIVEPVVSYEFIRMSTAAHASASSCSSISRT